MRKHTMMRIATAASAAVLCVALAGCSSTGLSLSSNTNNTETQNRTYMSQVNEVVAELDERLDDFADAVSRDDKVSMQTQATRAMKTIDELKNLQATDEISDVKSKYDAGCDSLKSALEQYVALYTSGAEITEESLASIQKTYNEGVDSLKAGDEAASAKK